MSAGNNRNCDYFIRRNCSFKILAGGRRRYGFGNYSLHQAPHGLLIGEKTAEELKLKSAARTNKIQIHRSASSGQKAKSEGDGEQTAESEKREKQRQGGNYPGRDIETGLPKSLRITEVEVREALSPVLTQIIEAVASVLEDAPPELTSDILEHGILLTGGGSLLAGLDHLIVERTHIPVILSEDPLTSVVRGTGKVWKMPRF